MDERLSSRSSSMVVRVVPIRSLSRDAVIRRETTPQPRLTMTTAAVATGTPGQTGLVLWV